MNIEFEKDKLFGSISAFSRNLSTIKEDSILFVNRNDDINFSSFNFDNILYLRQILNFSKLKYINLNFTKIEDFILKTLEASPHMRDFYLKKLNIYKNIPIAFFSNLENLYFDLMINIKNIKSEKDISLISGCANLYSKRLKELSEIISSANFKNDNDHKKISKYGNLLSFKDPNSSEKDLSELFAMIANPLKDAYSKLNLNKKCVKISHPEENFLKSQEFLSGIDSFLDSHFDFKDFFKTQKNFEYLKYTDQSKNINFNKNLSLKEILNSKTANILSNLERNLFKKSEKERAPFVLFDEYNSSLGLINNFILNFYLNSQFFIENLLHFLKKTFKIKGKAFDSKNIFWLLNCMDNESLLVSDSNQRLNLNEIGLILIQIIQYVIEKDFINNSEIISLNDLISAWQSGMKNYFNIDVSPLNFIHNFNFNPFEFGGSGLKVLSNLKASEFQNKIFNLSIENNSLTNDFSDQKIFFNVFEEILNLEQKSILFGINDLKTKESREIIFLEYKKYLKNKFGIDI
jgi:hypothetical protein